MNRPVVFHWLSRALPALFLGACSTAHEAPRCAGGTPFGDYCHMALQEGEACPDPDYPKPYQFSDGVVCGTEDSDIGADIDGLCDALGVGCQQGRAVCPSPPATLADCASVGTTYADCGGTGGPVFGCELRGKCHWFIHGCAPQTHQVTTCPSSDLCCLEDWPWAPDAAFSHPTAIFIHAFNTEPWGPERELNVDVGPAPSELMEPGLTCVPAMNGGNNPCHDAFDVFDTLAFDGGRRIELRPSIGIHFGFALLIEIEPVATGQRARVCRAVETDAFDYTCEFMTRGWQPRPLCATSGTVQVGDEGGHVDVEFEDGGRISGWW